MGLQDWGRDLLFGGLLAAQLLNQGQQAADGTGEDVGQPVPGADGADGTDGTDGADGVDGVDGADGAPGATGAQGDPGAQGEQGDQGPAGEQGEEGAGADGARGPSGRPGVPGEDGEDGEDGTDGSEFFDELIYDFYMEDPDAEPLPGGLIVDLERVEVPLLRVEEPPFAFRATVPHTYGGDNPVTLRLNMYRTGPMEPVDCFVIKITPMRLKSGYNEVEPGNQRFVRIEPVPTTSGDGEDPVDVFTTIDLPLNLPVFEGLEIFDDGIAAGDYLAFEFEYVFTDKGNSNQFYYLLSGERFESEEAVLVGATVLDPEGDLCEGDGDL